MEGSILYFMVLFSSVDTHRGKICGMCGNFNGIKEDDVRDANGDGKINVSVGPKKTISLLSVAIL